MENTEKKNLRKLLLGKRDNTSFDLMKIASIKIQKNLKKIESFRKATKIGAYYPTGSEIMTQDIIQELLSVGKQVYLPKTKEDNMEFRKITEFKDLEQGRFDIREPKENCPVNNKLDIILVPTVGITPTGIRLGYGHGFYDRFLTSNNTVTISLTLEKQIIKNIPKEKHDFIIDWIVTEDRVLETQR